MLDSFQIYEELSQSLDEKAARALTKTLTKIYEDLHNTVTKAEFDELKQIVAELAEAQKRTEERLDSLAQSVEELAEAQKRTEERLEELAEAQKRTEERLDSLTLRVEELAEAQKRTEERLEELAEAQKKTEERLDSLTLRVEELAEAQKRTEERLNSLTLRVEELAEAQKRTEERLEELAKAQQNTEESLNRLIKRVDNIEVQLGGLAMAVGYGIEDKLYSHMPNFAKGCFGVEPENIILRKNIVYPNGKYDEINLYIEGKLNGKDVLVIGECKAQPGKKDIDRFMKLTLRLQDYFDKEIYPFVVGYTFAPDVEKYISEKYPLLKYFKTYEIEHGKY